MPETSFDEVLLGSVATVNATTVSPGKLFEWINYTDISSVGPHLVEAPTKLSISQAPGRARRLLKKGDIAISTVRPNRRSFFMFNGEWENAICSTGFAVVSANNPSDANYLYAYLTSKEATRHYESICEGGAYPAFNGAELLEMPVPWPPEETREAIGNLSRLLREKVNLNLELVSNLSAAAYVLFKSWFVDFAPVNSRVLADESTVLNAVTMSLFPGAFEMVDDSEIPAGWRLGSLSELATLQFGVPFKSKLFNSEGDGYPLIRIRDLKSSGSKTFTAEVSKKAFFVETGDLLIGMDGTFDAISWAGPKSLLNQRLVKICPLDNVSPLFLKFAISKELKILEANATGTTVGHLSKGDIEDLKVPIPNKEVLDAFSETVAPIYDQISNLHKQNNQLERVRELLISRLISGVLELTNSPQEVTDEA